MLAITGLYAALLTVLIIALVFVIVGKRRRFQVGIGDGGEKSLQLAVRAHANAVEMIPIALILLAVLELHKANVMSLHIFGSLLVIGRLLHAYGLSRSEGRSFGRFWGTVITLLVLVAMALANVWLYAQTLSAP